LILSAFQFSSRPLFAETKQELEDRFKQSFNQMIDDSSNPLHCIQKLPDSQIQNILSRLTFYYDDYFLKNVNLHLPLAEQTGLLMVNTDNFDQGIRIDIWLFSDSLTPCLYQNESGLKNMVKAAIDTLTPFTPIPMVIREGTRKKAIIPGEKPTTTVHCRDKDGNELPLTVCTHYISCVLAEEQSGLSSADAEAKCQSDGSSPTPAPGAAPTPAASPPSASGNTTDPVASHPENPSAPQNPSITPTETPSANAITPAEQPISNSVIGTSLQSISGSGCSIANSTGLEGSGNGIIFMILFPVFFLKFLRRALITEEEVNG
jgi:hypothetical protein